MITGIDHVVILSRTAVADPTSGNEPRHPGRACVRCEDTMRPMTSQEHQYSCWECVKFVTARGLRGVNRQSSVDRMAPLAGARNRSSVGSRLAPPVSHVRLALFVAGTVGKRDRHETVPLVEPAGAGVALKRPQPQLAGTRRRAPRRERPARPARPPPPTAASHRRCGARACGPGRIRR